MRLWPWGSRKDRDDGAADDGPPAPPAPLPDPRLASPAPADGGWRATAPIQRTVPEHVPVFKTLDFGADLTAWQAPTFLRELSHEVSPMGPTGLVSGLTTTSAHPPIQRSSGPAIADRPVRAAAPQPPNRGPTGVPTVRWPGTIVTSGGPVVARSLAESPPPEVPVLPLPTVDPAAGRGAPARESGDTAIDAPSMEGDAVLRGDRPGLIGDQPPLLEPPTTPGPGHAELDPSPMATPGPGRASAPRPVQRIGLGEPIRDAVDVLRQQPQHGAPRRVERAGIGVGQADLDRRLRGCSLSPGRSQGCLRNQRPGAFLIDLLTGDRGFFTRGLVPRQPAPRVA